MAIEFTPIAEAILPGTPNTEAAKIVDTPDMSEADVVDSPKVAGAEYVIPEITSALTGD